MSVDAFPVETERLRLRRLNVSDLSDFQSYRSDPKVAQYQGWNPTPDDEALAFLDDVSSSQFFVVGQWFQVGIALRNSDRIIGDIGICLHTKTTAEIGFSLNAEYQRQGYASEAVAQIMNTIFSNGVTEIHAVTDARNRASLALLEKLGLEHTESVETEFEGEPCIEHRYVAYGAGI